MVDFWLVAIFTLVIVLVLPMLHTLGRTTVAFSTARKSEPELGVRDYLSDVVYTLFSVRSIAYALVALAFAFLAASMLSNPEFWATPIGPLP